MTFQHQDATRNAAADAVVDRVDVGGVNGTLEFLTNAGAILCTINLNSPAFGDAGATVAGRADLITAPTVEGTVGTAGTIGKFNIRNAAGGLELQGDNDSVTQTGGGGDIELTDVVVTVGSVITMSSLFYTFSAQGG